MDILFPTLIILTNHRQCIEVIDSEMSLEYLAKYIKRAMNNDDLMRIPEDDREHSMGSSSM